MHNGTSKDARLGYWCALTLLCALALTPGCAQHRARQHLEGVAKGWCETIRASQVIPVYPLTEDLQPGDVFLVQTTIESQAREYRAKGFLALDDRRTRLKDLDYTKAYFGAYWKDEFGAVPHERIKREAAGPPSGAGGGLSEAVAPRAAFPTYSFEARSGFGLGAAIPVKGVPVGLSFLRTDQVRGTVTIADARTYAAEELDLFLQLRKWSARDEVRAILSETVEKAGHRPVFLRVVSRVYLTGAVLVSLTRSDATGTKLSAGSAPNVSLLDANGNVNENYEKVLAALNNPDANPITALKEAGGAVKFIGASESTVALAESFDRMLVLGYLGFDVPVYPGGDLGVPIPTFQRLNGTLTDPPATRVGPLTFEQARFKISEAALEGLSATHPVHAAAVMSRVLDALDAPEFKEAKAALKSAQRAGPDDKAAFAKALSTFKEGAIDYVSVSGGHGRRYARYDEAFTRAFEERDK